MPGMFPTLMNRSRLTHPTLLTLTGVIIGSAKRLKRQNRMLNIWKHGEGCLRSTDDAEANDLLRCS